MDILLGSNLHTCSIFILIRLQTAVDFLPNFRCMMPSRFLSIVCHVSSVMQGGHARTFFKFIFVCLFD